MAEKVTIGNCELWHGDGPYPHCKAAISRTLVEGEFIGDGGPGDKAYFVMPNAKVSGGGTPSAGLPG